MKALDIEKALDCFWHKLLKIGLPTYIIEIIKSFLNDMTFYVKICKEMSPIYEIKAGVPQGSTLPPHRYNIYVADFPALNYCKISFYADDTCVYYIFENCQKIIFNIQKALDEIYG